MNLICTVVVTFNRLELLQGAVSALKKQTFPSDILVVNNGSTDGTSEWLASQSDLKVINQENVGGAGGFYTGMKYAAEMGYEYCWVMDDDVIPDPEALHYLYECYNKMSIKTNIGFLCSNIIDIDGNPANNPTINERPNSAGHCEWNKYLGDGIVGISAATFVSVFIPCKVIHEVGLPYKEFFIWGDDTEYTNRISMKYDSFCVGKSIVKHLRTGGAIDLVSLKDENRIQMYKYSIRNNWFNNRQHYFDKKKILINYLWHISIISRLFIRGQFKKIGIVISGVVEGIKFNPTIKYPEK